MFPLMKGNACGFHPGNEIILGETAQGGFYKMGIGADEIVRGEFEAPPTG